MDKIKDMKRSDWRRCLRREYRARECCWDGIPGLASVTILRELTGPLFVKDGPEDVKIADTGYTWLQIALREQRFWLTAMYDERDGLIQLYFDITAGNCFDDPENPCFRDMYLDIAVDRNGALWVLDRDELDAALEAGDVTREEYDRAVEVCERACTYLIVNKSTVIANCNKVLRELKYKEG